MLLLTLAMLGTTCPAQVAIPSGCYDAVGYGCDLEAASWVEGFVPWSAGEDCPTGCYDLGKGVLEARSATAAAPCGIDMEWIERFTIYGPASSNVPFDVVMSIAATVEGDAAVQGSLYALDDPLGMQAIGLTSSGTGEVVLHQSRPTSVEFTLVGDLATGTGTAAPAHGVGNIRFRGLPTGYILVACHTGLVPVPAAATSWGRVKAMYR
jgi:hypothetical protein